MSIIVIGGNYKNSIDSRDFGPIKENKIIGKVRIN
ncbi:MAG: S26 family signal peptidase [Enterococcus lemanii]